ncbi:branched-chain amino acid ABC transporter permease [Bosea sp. (in: a-proteobacteria)]|uniref:branched-chain amino acid ABC transporter permease n=1 Tax=Bosea sp. (in: a-proteobacteria) TaxID=1871050 RepID=UPI000A97B051|nr:branched-chain amino acid ABC transporter permease [Bosea sp. (in: a-proteobacteria)]MBN9439633.1 branched-chain amino acid ABC transporter permease [Bosea sp. (in: a-proteobacteria)]MBN9469238.1 branched-chain amino acid ABC transporter permease [Bosea sp. (in: a-proteobacteria)]
MTFAIFLEQIINGLIIGSMYALIGSGIALVYGTMRVLNLAHGEFYMLGGYFVFFLAVTYGVPSYLAIPVAVVATFILGMLIQRLTVHYLMGKEAWMFSTIAATLGLSIFLQNAALLTFGEQFQSVPYYLDGMIEIGSVRLPLQRLLILVVAIVTIGAMTFILKKTRLGWAIRATAQDRDAAAVVGIPAQHIYLITFGIAGALGAVAAAMLAPIYAINPWSGMPILLKGFVVVILGGLGSFPGAIAGGLLLGVVEAIGVQLTSSEWRDVIGFAMMIAVIWWRPWGLFGKKPS